MTWRCGHERIPENTHGPYPSHPGQCATCWREARRRADERYRENMTPRQRLRKTQNDTLSYARRAVVRLEQPGKDEDAAHRAAGGPRSLRTVPATLALTGAEAPSRPGLRRVEATLRVQS